MTTRRVSIKEAVEESGKTKQELARLMDLHPSTFGRKVSGEIDITVKEAERLAKLLRMPIDGINWPG